MDVAAYLYGVQFLKSVDHDSVENAENRALSGAGRPPGLLHHIAKASRDGDMATWLLSIGYRLDGEDEVNCISVSMNHFYALSYYFVDVSGATIHFA